MRLHLAMPWILLSLPPLVIFMLWAAHDSFVPLSPSRRRLALLLRCGLVGLVVLALARPTLILPSKAGDGALVVLLDVSSSVPDRTLEAARRWVRDLMAEPAGRNAEVITFAGRARRAPVVGGTPVIERHDAGDTDLTGALAFARGLLSDRVPRMILITDGNSTRPGARAALERAAADGVDLRWVRLPDPVDARVSAIRSGQILRRQQRGRVSVEVQSTRAGRARLRLEANGFLVQELTPTLHAGTESIDVPVEPSSSGLVRYAAEVRLDGDELPANDRWEELLPVVGPPRVLLVSNRPEDGEHLEATLAAQELGVDSISPGSLPAGLDGLIGYDEVILAGVPPHGVDRVHQAALAAYVRDAGGGLLLVSGESGLARAANDEEQPLEPVLPVELAAPSERQQPPVAVVLCIDRSGSMAGEKLGFAKQAALAVIDKLSPRDQLGVLAFDARYEWIVPLAPVADKQRARAAASSLGAGGGTKFLPALEEAYFALGSTEAALRHVVLLTDGVSTDADEFAALETKMRAAGVTVSTVAIGRGADAPLLQRLARQGGGRYSFAAAANQVPDIFVHEAKEIQREAAQRRDVRARVAMPARELAGIDFEHAPPLHGYVHTRAKPTTEVLLEVDGGDPLLVRWRYGLGTVAAFTSDASGAFSEAWIAQRWPGFARLWTQLARAVARPPSARQLTLSLSERGRAVGITVQALDAEGQFLDGLEMTAHVVDGEQRSHDVPVPQVAPGLYDTELPLPAGSVMARPLGRLAGRTFEGDWSTLARSYPRELQVVGTGHAFDELAAIGGGRVVAAPADALSAGSRRLSRSRPVATPLALLAVLWLLADVVNRKLRWERA